MSFLGDLQEELEHVDLDLVKEPTGELEDDQTAVGELPEELRRLYAVKVNASSALRDAAKEVIQLYAKHYGEDEPPPEYDDLAARHNLAAHRSSSLDDLFWTAVRHEFPVLHNKATIGLAEDWQVYWEEPRDKGGIAADLLKMIARAAASSEE